MTTSEPNTSASAAVTSEKSYRQMLPSDDGEKVAQAQAARRLVLGAWGCGVFRNDPAMAADAFGVWLASPRFAGAFDAVTFAVYDPSKTRGTLAAFADRLSPTA